MLNPQVPTDRESRLSACTGRSDCGTDPNDTPVSRPTAAREGQRVRRLSFMDMTEIEVYGRPS